VANHVVVTTDQDIDDDKLQSLLDEVNQERFGGNVVISKTDFEDGANFTIELNEYPCRNIWVNEDKNIEIRHGPGGDVVWWIDIVFTEELACKVDGIVDDHGVEETWKGRKNHYPTFRSFLDAKWSHNKQDPKVVAYFILREMEIAKEEAPNLEPFFGDFPELDKKTVEQIKEEMAIAEQKIRDDWGL
jgi:hypothetical protein